MKNNSASFDEPSGRRKNNAFDVDGGDRKRKSIKQERRLAETLGGRVVSGSGNKSAVRSSAGRTISRGGHHKTNNPGDVVLGDFLIDAKRTEAKSIRLDSEMFVKIQLEADSVGKEPALALELQGLSPMTEKDWIAMPKSVFIKLLGGAE